MPELEGLRRIRGKPIAQAWHGEETSENATNKECNNSG